VNTFDYTIDEELHLMQKYKLNATELLVIKMILLIKEHFPKNYLMEYLSIPEDVRGDFRDTLLSLQNKGIILKSYKIPAKGQKFDPEEVQINSGFFKTIWRESFDLGKELFDTYPMFGNINGTTVSLRGIAKKFDSLEDFFAYYGKTIRWDSLLHKKILDLIRWEQSNNVGFINFSLATFVIEQKWLELEALKDGKIANINFNALQAL